MARDGSVEWLCLRLDPSLPLLAALLDRERGGAFELRPRGAFEAAREYVEGTNVLCTTFRTESGSVRLTDALTTDEGRLLSWTELARRIECVEGSVELEWRLAPCALLEAETAAGSGGEIVLAGEGVLATVRCWGGESEMDGTAVRGRVELGTGESALLALVAVAEGPLPLPEREGVERRLDATIASWRRRSSILRVGERWHDALLRSALALELLVDVHSGGIVAAPTTSLPEQLGGSKNWDYRFCWVRDMAFALDAFIHLGYREQVHASFGWLLRASAADAPELRVLYPLHGTSSDEHTLELDGYRGSSPVRSGNAAAGQLQLDCYGELFETALLYVREGNTFDEATRRRLATTADHVVAIWRQADSGIWELRDDPQQFTLSKLACWVALDRALALAEEGELPDEHGEAWRNARAEIASYVDEECWSGERGCYLQAAGGDALDASVLRAVTWGFFDERRDRLAGTVAAVRAELGAGCFLYRYSGMREEEGVFLACSFWLADALTALGETDEAAAVIDGVLAVANDVGLLSEQYDPESGELLGNFPQALTHLALVNAVARLAPA